MSDPTTTEPFWLIAIAASADGIAAISAILAGLPSTKIITGRAAAVDLRP